MINGRATKWASFLSAESRELRIKRILQERTDGEEDEIDADMMECIDQNGGSADQILRIIEKYIGPPPPYKPSRLNITIV